MAKILIADEDKANVSNFKMYLKTSFPNLKSIITATNPSKDLINTIDAENPAVVVTDIHFFGVSPLSRLRDIYAKYPNIVFIFYGNYSDAQYLEKAMEFGMAEFMFRPVKPKEFHRCMTTALAHLDKLREQREKELKLYTKVRENEDIFLTTFLNTWINGQIFSEKELRNSFAHYKLDFGNNFTVIKLKIDRYRQIIENYSETEKQTIIYRIKAMVDVVLANNNLKGKTMFDGLNSVLMIVSGADNLPRIINMLDTLKLDIANVMLIKVTIGIGRTYSNPVDVGLSYKEANAALMYRFSMGYNTVIPIHFVEPVNTITFRYPKDREEKLIYMAVIGEYEYCKDLLLSIINSLKRSTPLPDNLVSKIVLNILVSINRYICEQNIIDANNFTDFFPTSEAINLKTLDEAHDYLDKNLKKFCLFTLENRKEKDRTILENTKKHLSEKYYETISLAQASMAQNTTPEYLNLLFMENENLTYAEYVMKTRMENAMRLLRDTNFEDDVIAMKVGYDNVRHFRGSFKQYYDISTIDYRTKSRTT